MKGNRNFRKKVSMVTAVICTASSLPFAALADEGAGDNFNLDGTLPIVKNADEMDPIEIAIVVPPERTVPTEDLVMVKKMVEDTGIPIKWVEIPSDGSTEKINLMRIAEIIRTYSGMESHLTSQFSIVIRICLCQQRI